MNSPYFKYMLAVLIGGTNGIAAHFISLSSVETVVMRCLVGWPVLVLLFFLTGNKLSVYKNRHDFIMILLSGIGMGANWLFLFEAYKQLGVSLGIVLLYCGPAIVVALSPFVFKEKLTLRGILSVLLALVGVIFISGDVLGSGLNIWGLLCGFGAMFTFAFYLIANKKSKTIEGLPNAVLTLGTATVFIVLFFIFHQGFPIAISKGSILPILWLGLACTAGNNGLYFSSIGQLPAKTVAIVGYLEPVVAIILSVLLLREKMTILQFLGIVMIIGGAIYGEMEGKNK